MTNAVINTDLKKYAKKYVVEDNTLWEVWDDNISKSEVIWDMENIADLLNNLNDEDEQLKSYVGEMEDYLARLEEENEQLKRRIGNLEHTRDFCADVCADCERLEKENEQLKMKLQRERTSSTKQHLKWSNEAEKQIKELSEENEKLKRKNMIYQDKIRGLMKNEIDEKKNNDALVYTQHGKYIHKNNIEWAVTGNKYSCKEVTDELNDLIDLIQVLQNKIKSYQESSSMKDNLHHERIKTVLKDYQSRYDETEHCYGLIKQIAKKLEIQLNEDD